MAAITENMLTDVIDNLVSTMVKVNLELIMNEEIRNFMSVEQDGCVKAATAI